MVRLPEVPEPPLRPQTKAPPYDLAEHFAQKERDAFHRKAVERMRRKPQSKFL